VVEAARELVPIGATLPLLLLKLSSVLGVTFDPVECERIFVDAVEDPVSAKQYVLFESPNLAILAFVDEYEPETIWLEVRGGRGVCERLRRVVLESQSSLTRD
jgi:hypothetical protein